jgi:phosphohistidine phosphatase SixA
MERKSKIVMGIAGAALVAVSLLPAAHGGRRERLTVDGATRALVYGQADASWTRRTAELVAGDADAARALAHVAEASNVDGVVRSRALDALAAAGDAPAQEAMRHALSSPALRADATYPMLVARLAGESPTFDTLIYLAQLRESAKSASQLEVAEAAAPVCHRLHQARASLAHKR